MKNTESDEPFHLIVPEMKREGTMKIIFSEKLRIPDFLK